MLLLAAHTKPTVEELKIEYVEYYADVPVQKYAAMAIARDEDTIIRWRKEDPDFADAVQRAKAAWIRKRLLATKAEFALERLEKDVFSASTSIEIQNQPSINQIDPNTPRAKELVQASLDALMDLTRRKVSA